MWGSFTRQLGQREAEREKQRAKQICVEGDSSVPTSTYAQISQTYSYPIELTIARPGQTIRLV